jgi:eukaryotic-like serine/threonine-protein kinase
MPTEERETRALEPAASRSGSDDPTTAGHGGEAAPTRQADTTLPPQRIGRFSIVRTLGRGGMGTVYLALDARSKKQVALKVIPAGPDADPNDLARFRAEAEAVERLDHPNIVKLFDVGDVDGQAFISMEYVDGGNLARRLKEVGAFPPKEAARLVEPLARAVHYAHEHGVVHRDLKPSNILLASGQRSADSQTTDRLNADSSTLTATPKLADFGLAKQLDKSLRLTRTGIAIGTPHYMAPEQARGWSDQIGPSSDVYGLGAILYELLVGHPPFSGSSPLETMEQVVRKKPMPPSHLRHGIPADLEAICLKCLEKAVGDRYPNAQAVAEDLQHFLSDEPISEVPTRREIAQKRRGWLLTAAGALILAALSATAGWYFTHRANKELVATATKDERRARLEAAIALCEDDQIQRGLEMMPKPSDDGLPIDAIVAAWKVRVPVEVKTILDMKATVAAVSPRGDLLATAQGSTVQLWNASDWSVRSESWNVDGSITALDWSDDGQRLAIGTVAGEVYLCHALTGKLDANPVSRPNRSIAAVAFAPKGVQIVFGGDSLTQELVPPEKAGEAIKPARFDLDAGPFATACIAPGTGDVATITGSIRLFDTNEGRWRDLPPGGDASAIAYSQDANALAVGTQSGRVRLWDAVARTPLSDGFDLGEPVAAVTVRMTAADYDIVACGSNGKFVVLRIGRPFIAPPIRISNLPGKEVLGVAFAGDESLFVTSPYGVTRWRIQDGKRYGTVNDYPSSERFKKPDGADARFSAGAVGGTDGSFVVGGSGGRMFFVDSDAGGNRDVPGLDGMAEVTAAARGPDGQTACACVAKSRNRSVVRHWAGPMEDNPTMGEFGTVVHQQTYLSGGTALALACGDNFVRIWEPVSSKVRAEFDCQSPVLAVAASEDGQILAGCADGTARLWNISTATQIRAVYHRSEVRAVAFHKGDLLTASADGTARRWHKETGLPIGPPLRHPDAISALSTQRDLVATGGRGRYVRVWRLP